MCFFFNGTAQFKRISTNSKTLNTIIPSFEKSKLSIPVASFKFSPSEINLKKGVRQQNGQLQDPKVLKTSEYIPVNIDSKSIKPLKTASGATWALKLNVPNAKGIGLLFNQLKLADDAEMYIFDEQMTLLDSAITASSFRNTDVLSIPVFDGQSIFIFLIEKGNSGELKSSFTIRSIEAGIIEQQGSTQNRLLEYTTNCIPNFMCYSDKINQARAVMQIVVNGYTGTGTLINSEANNGKAYVLTAFHLIDADDDGVLQVSEISGLSNSSFRFQRWFTECTGSIENATLNFTGSTLVVQDELHDIVLLEMTQPPGLGDGVTFSGWNRSTSEPSDNGCYILHHPLGEPMKISFSSSVNDMPAGFPYWNVNFSIGVVWKGSSGSGLINPNNQLVGVLSHGASSCIFTDFSDNFTRFDKIWPIIQSHISPGFNLGQQNTINLADTEIYGPNLLPCVGQSATYGVPELYGCTYAWTVSSGISINSGQGTRSINISRNGSISDPPYGTISVTITSATGISRTLTKAKGVWTDGPSNSSLEVVYSGPSCSTSSNITLSYGARQDGNSGCAIYSNSDIAEVEWQFYTPYSYTVANNSGSFNCPSVIKGGVSVTFPVMGSSYYVTARCRVKNKCGSWGDWTPGFSNVIRSCYSSNANPLTVSVFPNPASTELNIAERKISNEENQNDFIIEKVGIKGVNTDRFLKDAENRIPEKRSFRLLNDQGIVVREGNLNDTDNTKVNVSDIPNGQYFLHLKGYGNMIKRQIVISH